MSDKLLLLNRIRTQNSEYVARFSSDKSSDESDSSGEYSDKEELNESIFMSDLKKWFYNYNIPYSHLDALLKTLKPYHSELPVSSKTFLKDNEVQNAIKFKNSFHMIRQMNLR
ncbi:hypothetical protein TSAR_015805 [Trichomalopsis sarcophagae]|uniref:Uncharacterized protein n=1 Tax=Trichomalopsis sarcophagae TaxID=543379 RepID=A0A232EJV7_9HYME|nr:hypothetical protein TSAR_015805 [Trichomalopsis sarcophagae]